MEMKEELELLCKGIWVLQWGTDGVHGMRGISSWQMLEQGVIPVHVGMESAWEKDTALLGALWLTGDTGGQESKIIICMGSLRELGGFNPKKTMPGCPSAANPAALCSCWEWDSKMT